MGIQYLITAYVDSNGKFSEKRTDFTIHDVIRVVEGSLEDNLDLLCYRCSDIFPLLSLDRVLRPTDQILERLSKYPRISAASLTVIYEDTLYGVVIKDVKSAPLVIGVVQSIITTLDGHHKEDSLLLNVDYKQSVLSDLLHFHQDVQFDSKRHMLITVPLGGHCFVQYNDTKDETGDNPSSQNGKLSQQFPNLVLLIGNAFLFIEEMSVNWVKFSDCYMVNTTKCPLGAGQFMFMYNGGLIRNEPNNPGYSIYGLGPRSSTINETYFYSSMHCPKPISFFSNGSQNPEQQTCGEDPSCVVKSEDIALTN